MTGDAGNGRSRTDNAVNYSDGVASGTGGMDRVTSWDGALISPDQPGAPRYLLAAAVAGQPKSHGRCLMPLMKLDSR